jgi:translation initiation factor eIF-2B subunit delta
MAEVNDSKGKAHLAGQDTEEAKAAVQAQRDLKKKKDNMRKLSSKLKAATDDETRDKVKAEIDQHEKDIALLDVIVNGPASSTIAEEVAPKAAAAPSPPVAVTAVADDVKTKAHLQGQDSAEARDAVQAQRELKKAKDGLRKLASKLKAASADQKDALEEQLRVCEAEIARLEKIACSEPPKIFEVAAASAPAPDAAPAKTKSVVAPLDVAVTAAPALPKQASMASLLRQTQQKPPNLAPFSTPVDNTVPAFQTPCASSLSTPMATPGRKSTASSGASALVFKPVQPQLSPTVSNVDGRMVEPPTFSALVHPRVAETGLLMQNMQLVGGNARAIAFLDAILEVARTTPVLNVPVFTNRERREFERIVNDNFKFLSLCREPCAGMTFVKRTILSRMTRMITTGMPERVSSGLMEPSSPVTNLAPSAFHSRSLPASTSRFHHDPSGSLSNMATDDALRGASGAAADENDDSFHGAVRDIILQTVQKIKDEIFQSIHTLVEERAQPHITSGDCILTYGRSSSIELILQHAVAMKRRIRVIVVDCGPLYEGKTFAARLQRLGIPVTYGLITAICTLLPSCTKVMIGASAVLQSGEVYGRAGTATVATAAKAFRKPVLCMCESHKFVPKVWMGSLVQNSEIGDLQQRRPVGVQSQNINVHVDQATKPCAQREQNPSGYLYDLTPASSVDMVVCEMGCLSTSAIAAAIRDRQDREVFMQP